MSFTLQVEFSGICTYVVDPVSAHVAVLMPDARGRVAGSKVHWDKDLGDPHIGYLRFNLADLVGGVPLGSVKEPWFECVHRFEGEALYLGSGAADKVEFEDELALPALEVIATDPDDATRTFLRLDPAVFTDKPPANLLLRTVLPGGKMSNDADEKWEFTEKLANGKPHAGDFASFVTWKKEINSEFVTVRLVPFDASHPETTLSLRPANGSTVKLKVVNFCDDNAMEWGDFGKRQVDKDDKDFKWNYRLFQPRKNKWEDLLGGGKLPIPRAPKRGRGRGVEDCLGVKTGQTVVP